MDLYVNGLAATPVRVKLLEAIRDTRGRISYDPISRAAYDNETNRKVTAQLREFIDHDWIRPRRPDEPLTGGEWSEQRTYYRITESGEAAIERGKR